MKTEKIKNCKKCNKPKPVNMDNFHKHPEAADGFLNICKDCVNERNSSRRKKQNVYNEGFFYHDKNLATI